MLILLAGNNGAPREIERFTDRLRRGAARDLPLPIRYGFHQKTTTVLKEKALNSRGGHVDLIGEPRRRPPRNHSIF